MEKLGTRLSYKAEKLSPLLSKARSVFRRVGVTVAPFCAVGGWACHHCYPECSMRVEGVYSATRHKLIGWFEEGKILKTNARPSKRYAKRYLGGEERRRRRYGPSDKDGDRGNQKNPRGTRKVPTSVGIRPDMEEVT